MTCSCGSGIPVTVLEIASRGVEVFALPLIFDVFLFLSAGFVDLRLYRRAGDEAQGFVLLHPD